MQMGLNLCFINILFKIIVPFYDTHYLLIALLGWINVFFTGDFKFKTLKVRE